MAALQKRKGPPTREQTRSPRANPAAFSNRPQLGVLGNRPAQAVAKGATAANSNFSATKFNDSPISQASKNGIQHEFMTDVQAATLEPGLAGKDLLVQAKTGTGKTLAFLLPAIERLQTFTAPSKEKISVLVLSPTRELALQIAEEANALLQHHPFAVQFAIGGTNINTERNRLSRDRCDVLIATPGRLIDHMENSGLVPRFSDIRTLVLDEADRLLDQGFSADLHKILGFLPPRHCRQTLMFSATVSTEIKVIAAKALRRDHEFVTTLDPTELNTHEHVDQSSIIIPIEHHLPASLALIREDMASNPQTSKCMIFYPTARAAGLAAVVLSNVKGIARVLEIHSRRSQSARIKAANDFRDASSAVLISSDVAARGMDFPGVTLVIQIGLPASGEQYIHRLGRTARAGAAGRGIIVLAPFEVNFLKQKQVSVLPIQPYPTQLALDVPTQEINTSLDGVDNDLKAHAYRASLGYYQSNLKVIKKSREELVAIVNDYARVALRYPGDAPPTIEARTVGKMNMKGVPGLNVVAPSSKPKPVQF